eukprot:4123261-Pyramimonas_sp.AAC.1
MVRSKAFPGICRLPLVRSERTTYMYMNPRWFRERALHQCSYHAAGLANRGAVFMCIAGRVRPLWAPYQYCSAY